jgi:hypothetical protein
LKLFAGFSAKALRIALANYRSFSRSGHCFTLGLCLGFCGIKGLSGGACDPLAIEFVLYEVACHGQSEVIKLFMVSPNDVRCVNMDKLASDLAKCNAVIF